MFTKCLDKGVLLFGWFIEQRYTYLLS
jgi:hypothetical protein